jgi:hypothetical protein
MSNKKIDEDLLKAFEEMLDSMDDFDFEFEDDGGYGIIHSYPKDEDLEYPDEPPPIPKELCKHENKEKKPLFNSFYYKCKDCGEEDV